MDFNAGRGLGGRTTARNAEHFCGPENAVNMIEVISDALRGKKKGFKANEDLVSGLCGVDSAVLTHLWFSYGGALLKQGFEAIHLVWFMSHAKLYIPWIVLGRFWGVGKTKFQETAMGVAEALYKVMDEVGVVFFFGIFPISCAHI